MLTANWNPGTPTADANFGGWINFGGQIGTRTALHEIAHALGIGTAPKWRQFARDGKWTGQYGIQQLHEFDGPDAVLHCDNQHFWPYGLNYDTEGGAENFKRNVMMVTAMRADMGLGPPPHPAAAALKAAKADAVAAHSAFDKAVSNLSLREAKLKSSLDSQPEIIQAEKTAASAKNTYDNSVAATLKSVRESSGYKSAEQSAVDARKKVDDLRADPTSKTDEVAAAANAALTAKSNLTRLETEALASNPQVRTAGIAFDAATKALGDARQTAMINDSDLMTDQHELETARTKAATTDQAVTVAEQAALKEASVPANSKVK